MIISLIWNDLDFADDIALLSSTFANAQNLLNNLLREAQAVGLSLNIDKSNICYIYFYLFMEGKKLELVDDSKYLGTFLKSSSNDFKHRKTLSWAACIKPLGCRHLWNA